MVFTDIQAVLKPEFTSITTFLDKLIISWVVGGPKIRTRKNLNIRPNNLEVFMRRSCVDNFLKTEAFQNTQKSRELNAREKNKIWFSDGK